MTGEAEGRWFVEESMACPPMGLWLRASLAFARYVFFFLQRRRAVFIEKAAGEDRCNRDEGHAWRSKMEAEERQHWGVEESAEESR